MNRLPWERWHPAGEPAERTTPAGRDAGAPRFMVPIHVHSLENIPTHEPTPFPNSRTKNERDGRGRFEGPHCGAFALVLVLRPRPRPSPSSFVLVLRPLSVDGDEQHTDLCAGTHGARFMVTIHVHSLENFATHEPAQCQQVPGITAQTIKFGSVSPSILSHGFRRGFPIEFDRSTLRTSRLRMHGRPKGPSFLSPGHRPGYLSPTDHAA